MKHIYTIILLLSIGASSQIRTAASSAGTAHPRMAEEIYSSSDLVILDYTTLVAPQQGVDCGLHSLKNSIALFNYLTRGITLAERNRQLQSSEIGALGSMGTCRTTTGQGLLDPEALYHLAKGLRAPYNIPIIGQKLLILDNLSNPEVQRTVEQNAQLAELAENIASGTLFVHAFILGTMNQIGDRTGHGGHWIAAVLERAVLGGRLRLHIANSSASYVNTDPSRKQAVYDFDKDMGLKLVAFLSALNPMNLKFSSIEELIPSMQSNISLELYEPGILNLKDIIDTAAKQRILTNPRFNRYKAFFSENLLTIPNEEISPTYGRLKDYMLNFLLGDSIDWNPPQIEPIARPTPIEQPAPSAASTISSGIWRMMPTAVTDWWNAASAQTAPTCVTTLPTRVEPAATSSRLQENGAVPKEQPVPRETRLAFREAFTGENSRKSTAPQEARLLSDEELAIALAEEELLKEEELVRQEELLRRAEITNAANQLTGPDARMARFMRRRAAARR